MARFYELPAELQIQIFDYLDAADIKRVRAVSKKFRDNATPPLFCSIVVCPRYQALGAFQNVSLHPIYAGYVRTPMYELPVRHTLTSYTNILGQKDNL
jgi:hypothetical protein